MIYGNYLIDVYTSLVILFLLYSVNFTLTSLVLPMSFNVLYVPQATQSYIFFVKI
jgi:hypothetical protein